MAYAWLVILVFVLLYVALSYQLYRRAFAPPKPIWLDDFSFTPFEFQADYEEVELVTADGFNVILYSYRGMPGSDRAPITFGIREVLELQAAIAFARKRIPNARIGLLGYSMGAVVSLLGAAGEPGVQALVLDSPFSELRRLLIENVRSATKLPGTPFVWLAGLMFRFRTRCSLAACSPIDVLSSLEPRPLFFIHGGSDAITNVNHSRRLYDAYRGPREIWIVQGAPHAGAYFADRPLYVERVAGFFARHLGLDVSSHLRLVEEEEVS